MSAAASGYDIPGVPIVLKVKNILTVDVEDWHQSTVDRRLPITLHVHDSTLRILDMLRDLDLHGTFFVLGLVARRFPDLIRRIDEEGHEVACHGHSHAPVYSMNPEQFRMDLRNSLSAIKDATGKDVLGYRAPDFSIRKTCFWALEILAEEGMRYDSSIFPFRGTRYGVGASFVRPYRVRCRANPDLLEFPLTTAKYMGFRLPAAGGGYFRLFPYFHHRAGIARLNRHDSPATAYFHPYEIDTTEIRHSPHRLPMWLRISQGLGRRRVEQRMRRLLREFAWGPVRGWLNKTSALTENRTLDLTHLPNGSPIWLREGTSR